MKRFLLILFLAAFSLALPAAAWMPQGITPGSTSIGDNDDDGVLPRQVMEVLGGACVTAIGTPTSSVDVGIVWIVLPDGSSPYLFVPKALAKYLQVGIESSQVALIQQSMTWTGVDGESKAGVWTKKPTETLDDFNARLALAKQILQDFGATFP